MKKITQLIALAGFSFFAPQACKEAKEIGEPISTETDFVANQVLADLHDGNQKFVEDGLHTLRGVGVELTAQKDGNVWRGRAIEYNPATLHNDTTDYTYYPADKKTTKIVRAFE